MVDRLQRLPISAKQRYPHLRPGKPLTQVLTITYGGKKLVNGRDYTLTWKNNKNIGTASVTIKGKGKYNGSVTKKFRITVQKNAVYTVSRLKYKISNADTSGKGTVVFTGAKVRPGAKVIDSVLMPGAIVEDGAVVIRALVANGVNIGKGALVGSADSEHIELIAKRVKGAE